MSHKQTIQVNLTLHLTQNIKVLLGLWVLISLNLFIFIQCVIHWSDGTQDC